MKEYFSHKWGFLCKFFLSLFLIISFTNVYTQNLNAGARPERSESVPAAITSQANPFSEAQLPNESSNLEINYAEGLYDHIEPSAEPSRAETVLRAIEVAYPDKIRAVEFYEGDWTIIVYSERFYWAEGRLLPASLRDRVNEFSPLPFYNYPSELPPWVDSTPEESERMREQMLRRQDRSRPVIGRSPHFFDALWRSRNRDEAWEKVKTIRFLGRNVTVHYSILVQLSLVEQQILRAARNSSEIRSWIDGLQVSEGWVWRDIAQTQNRSFHAYGIAVDLLPTNLRGLQTYWLWSSQHTGEWWNIPYTRRYHPPEEVIRIFESLGFVWGGKWRYFDTMHFEYRPEVIVLSGIPLMDLRDRD